MRNTFEAMDGVFRKTAEGKCQNLIVSFINQHTVDCVLFSHFFHIYKIPDAFHMNPATLKRLFSIHSFYLAFIQHSLLPHKWEVLEKQKDGI